MKSWRAWAILDPMWSLLVACRDPRSPPAGSDPSAEPALTTLAGDVTIGDATDAAALRGVDEIGGDLVVDGAALERLELPELRRLGGSLVVWRAPDLATVSVPALEEVGGDVSLYDLDAFDSFAGFSALTTVGGSLSVTRVPLVRDFAGLEGLEGLGDELYLYHLEGLRSADGLSSLASIGGDLQVLEAYALRELRLPALRSAGRVELFEADALTRVDLPALETVEGYELHECGSMVDLGSFPRVTALASLAVEWDAALSSLDGFPALTSAGSVKVEQVTVSSFAGLGALESIRDGLLVRGVRGAAALDLPALRSVGELQVVRGDDLVTVGLDALDEVRLGASFANRQLPGCAIEAFFERVEPPVEACAGNLADACDRWCGP